MGRRHLRENAVSPEASFWKWQGVGEIMVWEAINWRGKSELVVVRGKIDQFAYVQMLQQHLEPFIEEHYPRGY